MQACWRWMLTCFGRALSTESSVHRCPVLAGTSFRSSKVLRCFGAQQALCWAGLRLYHL